VTVERAETGEGRRPKWTYLGHPIAFCPSCGHDLGSPAMVGTGAEQIAQARLILQQWADLKGQDLCFHHPEILRRLCATLGVEPPITRDGGPDPSLPPRAKFEAGCREYQDQLYGSSSSQ
jgi:hypothetical protein